MKNTHTFHIPVMGIGFTVDTPFKVAPFGIDSVMTIGDDRLDEKLRKVYCEQYGIPYVEINDKEEDYRAKRITAYLNLIKEVVENKFEDYKNSAEEHRGEIEKYIEMLPDSSIVKEEYQKLTASHFDSEEVGKWVGANLSVGSIDVNIMTKLDKENYVKGKGKGEKLGAEHNDAHVTVRGYANSDVTSSIILSAGLNPRLFGYMEEFDDFFPNANGEIKKKIVLKVSDYRSAIIQGKFLAKRGLWVSEYRIESGLNCGGHAFATEGYLMGPILAEFKNNRKELLDSVYEILESALSEKNLSAPKESLPFKVTAQGGVGTAEEHQFLLDHYKLDSVGWGTPFLLVPEATSVDSVTMDKLCEAKEKDLYLSNLSPIGVPFNSLRGNTKEIERLARIEKGRPGSPCVEGHLELFNTEFSDKPLCTASRLYQSFKIKELDQENVSPEVYKKRFTFITEKSCLCTGLVNPALLVNNISAKAGGDGVEVCPGPNMAYFSKIMSLKEITDHIYGRANVISRTDRPNMFIKELDLYINFLVNKIEEARESMTKKQQKYLINFSSNLQEGIGFYYKMFDTIKDVFSTTKSNILRELEASNKTVLRLSEEINKLTVAAPISS